MAETLGSLCDKLTVVKLKEWHADDPARVESLRKQEQQLQQEIAEYLAAAFAGAIPLERLTFAANKVYKKEGNPVPDVTGTIGEVFSHLADVNCRLWHTQERVYEFEKVQAEEKDQVIKQLAIQNLERTRCIDQIDRVFAQSIEAFRANRATTKVQP
jgi:hypothetical protein